MDSLFTIVPLLMIAFVVVVAVVLLRKVPALLKAREQAVTVPGRVLEVKPEWSTRTNSADAGGGTSTQKYYLVRCSYAVGDRTFAGWSDERYPTRDWTEGQDVTLWLDPDRPDIFALKQPASPAAVIAGTTFVLAVLVAVAAFAVFFMHTAAQL